MVKFSYTNIVTFTSVFGILFLSLLAPPAIAILICATFFTILFIKDRKLQIDSIGLLVLLNFIYWVVSGFLVGSIHFSSFGILDFYDGDGRVFISYISLLYFCVSRVRLHNLEFVIKVLKWTSFTAIFLCLFWYATRVHFLAHNEGTIFTGFITSHTGAGTFYGAIAILLFFCGFFTKNKPLLITALLMVMVVFATASRATILGIVIISLWYIAKNFQIKNLILFTILGGILIVLMPVLTSGTFQRIISLINWETLQQIQHQISIGFSSWQPGSSEFELADGDANLMSRIVLWGYALHHFMLSPFVGIGWGRFNDAQIVLSGIPGLVAVAFQGERIFNVSSAHNSYLMVLCESGILGLWLLLKIWLALYKRLKLAQQDFINIPFLRGYYVGCQALIVFTLTAALFGHTLAAPANCVPVLTIVGAGLAYHRTERFKHNASPQIAILNTSFKTEPACQQDEKTLH
jgi:O-antigen ligase